MRGTSKRTRVRTMQVLAIFIMLNPSPYRQDGVHGSIFDAVSIPLERCVEMRLVEQVQGQKSSWMLFPTTARE